MTLLTSKFVKGGIPIPYLTRSAVISTVAYKHQLGIPARFCAGLLPVADIAEQLTKQGIDCTVRIIDPTPIANHCNGWQLVDTSFRDIITNFFEERNVLFHFDEAEPVTSESLELLLQVGSDLHLVANGEVATVTQRIIESGKKHGGDLGAENALLYMAAHPFSWLDMYHSLIWKKRYPSDSLYINIMSKSEERFAIIRNFLKTTRSELGSGISPTDYYTTLCSTPCYIPLEGEPLISDVQAFGVDWCLNRYEELKKRSSNHERICKDFKALTAATSLVSK